MSSGGPATGVTPSAANGATVETLRALPGPRPGSGRGGCSGWRSVRNRAQRSRSRPASSPGGLVHAQREGIRPALPLARAGRFKHRTCSASMVRTRGASRRRPSAAAAAMPAGAAVPGAAAMPAQAKRLRCRPVQARMSAARERAALVRCAWRPDSSTCPRRHAAVTGQRPPEVQLSDRRRGLRDQQERPNAARAGPTAGGLDRGAGHRQPRLHDRRRLDVTWKPSRAAATRPAMTAPTRPTRFRRRRR